LICADARVAAPIIIESAAATVTVRRMVTILDFL
jgi:hypothetical protein